MVYSVLYKDHYVITMHMQKWGLALAGALGNPNT